MNGKKLVARAHRFWKKLYLSFLQYARDNLFGKLGVQYSHDKFENKITSVRANRMLNLSRREGDNGDPNDHNPICHTNSDNIKGKIEELSRHCELYTQADNRKAFIQIANTLIPFFVLCAIMFACFEQAYWLCALLTIPAAGFLTRLFIIQHDCGHNSFFNSRIWNNRLGRVLSLLTWTPYDFWRKTHNIHHSSSGNLDKRGYGSIETLTLKEYKDLSPRMRFLYRLYRNPLILLGIGTPFFIIIGQRFPIAEPFPFVEVRKLVDVSHIWKSVLGFDIALLVFYGTAGYFLGYLTLFSVYLPIVIMTSWLGGWLFFIQHQFEDAHWEKASKWDYKVAAFMGSSYYALPPILQWFTGNIGLHHIHHLCAKIPNYRLQECMDHRPELATYNKITLLQSLKYANLSLWDEEERKMIGFPIEAQ